ncbi:MAG: flagellar export protein FliJ [Gammaproteobacteria bacterium]
MNRKDQLDKVALINDIREKEASRNLADDNSRHENLHLQLAKLTAYREEYSTRLNIQLEQIDSATALRDYHNFIRVLDSAIQEQQQAITECAAQLQASKNRWAQSRTEVKKIDNLREKKRQLQRAEAARLEQKQSDEMSINRHTRK